MNKLIIYISICMLIISCASQSKRAKNNNTLFNKVQLHSNIYSISPDSILVKTFISVPVSNLVFTKKEDYFNSSIEVMVRIEDVESDSQVKRVTNKEDIKKKYYIDTRSEEDIYQLSYDFLLAKGNYKIISNIKDLDSFNTWDISDNIVADSNQPRLLSAYYYEDGLKHYLHGNLIDRVDSLWLDFSAYNFNQDDYRYSIIKNKDTLKTDKFKDCKTDELLVECPFLINESIIGDVEIHIQSNSPDAFLCLVSIYNNSSLWSEDLDEIRGVMSYILSYSEIKNLYNLNDKEQKQFVLDYLSSKDPDLDTDQNEFIEIIKRRFKYANDNFSKHSVGWSTDRGEIYILYGPPESMDSFGSQPGNSNGMIHEIVHVEKWYYSDKIFIFSNENTFGEMQLINSL